MYYIYTTYIHIGPSKYSRSKNYDSSSPNPVLTLTLVVATAVAGGGAAQQQLTVQQQQQLLLLLLL